ncbi:hypothetical protein C7M84_009757 [Penaeus vannamei]|uniref:RING-type domain-containing protein n=1 Tax=Penaeus vannamei TaxID=6689 RepID=A0A423T627_PENVA|nr:hypothetical protein C7M84_009757 [Penaeus vannamei]
MHKKSIRIQWRHPATPLQRYRFHSRSLYSLPEFLRREAVSLADAVEVCATPGGRSSRPKLQSIDRMRSDFERAVTCNLCWQLFATGPRAPLVLPKCGDTFCRACLRKVQPQTAWMCPLCAHAYTEISVPDLPVNFLALVVTSVLKESFHEKIQPESKGSSDHFRRLSLSQHRIHKQFIFGNLGPKVNLNAWRFLFQNCSSK